MMGKILYVSTVALLSTVRLLSQDKSTSMKAVQRLNRAPVNKEVLQVSLPRPTKIRLSNGLTLLFLERHKLPTIAASIWIKTGALSDPKRLPGLASFAADMLREGTDKGTSEQISEELDSIGGDLSAEARFQQGTTSVNISGLVDSADRLMELMSEIVIHPSFPESELKKYKKRRQAQLEEERSQPGFLAREKFYGVLYGDFPASAVAPTPQSLAAVKAEDLRKYHDACFAPENAILGITGDLTVTQARSLADKYFGSWRSGRVPATKLPPIAPLGTKKIYLIDRPGSVQTEIFVGNLAVKRVDPDYIPLRVLNRVLGGGIASRLFLDLREEKGYTYGAYSNVTGNIYPGIFGARTEVRNAVTDDSIHELLVQLERMREEAVPADELEDSRRSIIAEFALSLENPQELLDDWLTLEYYGLPLDYWDRYPKEIAQVTSAKVQEMAKKHIDLDHLQIVCVGDGKQIESVLQQYGSVEATDADGNAVKLSPAAAAFN
jgi:predicted Zn-dependent peptidase